MRIKNFIIILILFFIGCGETEPLNYGLLQERDGVHYRIDNNKVYSGPVFNIDGTSEGTLKKGKFHGPFKFYDDNNQIKMEISYKAGIEDGPFKSYYKNGQLEKESTYKDGNKHGPHKSYYENGKLGTEVTYKDGKFDGELKYYFENGVLATIITFNNGNLDGSFKRFSEQSILTVEGNLYFNFNDPSFYDELYGKKFVNNKIAQFKMLLDNPLEYNYSNRSFFYSREVNLKYNIGLDDYPIFNRFDSSKSWFDNLFVGNRKVYNNEGELIFEANYDSSYKLDGKVKYYIFHRDKDLYNKFYKTYFPIFAIDKGDYLSYMSTGTIYEYINDKNVDLDLDQPIKLYQMISKDIESPLIYINHPAIPNSIHNIINNDKQNAFIEFTYKNGRPFDGIVLYAKNNESSWTESDGLKFVEYEEGKPKGYSIDWERSAKYALDDEFDFRMYGDDDAPSPSDDGRNLHYLIKLSLSGYSSWELKYQKDDLIKNKNLSIRDYAYNIKVSYLKDFSYYVNDKGEISGMIFYYEKYMGDPLKVGLIIDLKNNIIESSDGMKVLGPSVQSWLPPKFKNFKILINEGM